MNIDFKNIVTYSQYKSAVENILAYAERCPTCGRYPEYSHTDYAFVSERSMFLRCPVSCDERIYARVRYKYGDLEHDLKKLASLVDYWNEVCVSRQPPITMEELESLYECE